MSVFTSVNPLELTEWLKPLQVGQVESLVAIAAGVQNSNYFLNTSSGQYVLTLFEDMPAESLDFYLGLMAHLAQRAYPCPSPFPAQNHWWRPLAGKPAALFSRLPGICVEQAGPAQLHRVGRYLGRLHCLAADFPGATPNPRGSAWRSACGARLLPLLPADQQAMLSRALEDEAQQPLETLPQGVIHADLFRDNVLWENGQISGILDFYFAGRDALIYDLAVAANDWCANEADVLLLIAGYECERTLSVAERAAWHAARRAAALRFWLSRLDDALHPRPGAVVTVKDPSHFARLLERLPHG